MVIRPGAYAYAAQRDKRKPADTNAGAGYDQIDVHTCTDHGVRVSNTPTAVDDATADCNMFLILGALRGFNRSIFSLRDRKWRGGAPIGHDPQGKVLGILGMGGIGRNVKAKAEAFGMTVQYHNRKPLSEEDAGGAKYCGFEELLKTSDVLSLNLPLNVCCPSRLLFGQSRLTKAEKHPAYHLDAAV